MNYKEFFTTNNKSGWKTRENLLKKNNPEIHQKITEFTNTTELDSLPFKEKVWYFINDVKDKKKCCGCGAPVLFRGDLNKGYRDFCSLSCANQNGNLVERQKKSLNEKYGVDFFPEHHSFIEKQRATKKERYGDENYNNINKNLQTKKERYGDENYNNITAGKETCLSKYGVENPFQFKDFKEKSKQTNLNKLGVEYVLQSDIVKEKVKIKNLNNLKKKYPFIIDVDNNIVKSKCLTCNSIYEITRVLLNERNRMGYGLCTICNPIGVNSKSQYETDIIDYIKLISPDINIIQGDKTVLNGKEIDIYLPDYKIGIEFNGLYWHSELFKNNDYHINKTNIAEGLGIKLIQIFEDEWVYNQNIVKSRISNLLKLVTNKIYARKCVVKEVDYKESNDFLNNNHIQGQVKSKIRVGLYYDNELVSLMTFGTGRIMMGGKSEEYELLRFCNKINTSVIGGASKLLKEFIKTYNPNQIVSYADRRWSQGGIYEVLGFEFVHNTKPNYWYVFNNQRKYRFNYRKDILVKEGYDSTKSEHEIMLERKIYRIYDCGVKRYLLKLK